MKEFKNAKEYVYHLDKEYGMSWSEDDLQIAKAMEDYAQMYFERRMKRKQLLVELMRLDEEAGLYHNFFCNSRKEKCRVQCEECKNFEDGEFQS